MAFSTAGEMQEQVPCSNPQSKPAASCSSVVTAVPAKLLPLSALCVVLTAPKEPNFDLVACNFRRHVSIVISALQLSHPVADPV
ncbi:hypothetical protein ACQRIT_000336 [Beauveria bassiana]